MSLPAPIAIAPLFDHLSHELAKILTTRMTPFAMVAIQKGGTWIANALYERLELDVPFGSLDISFYRDDFTHIGLNPQVKPSHLPFQVDGSTIVLVDDVLYTGRTVRAALNELFDYGRPKRVLLVVLVERNGRELPIAADIVGTRLTLPPTVSIEPDADYKQLIFVERTLG